MGCVPGAPSAVGRARARPSRTRRCRCWPELVCGILRLLLPSFGSRLADPVLNVEGMVSGLLYGATAARVHSGGTCRNRGLLMHLLARRAFSGLLAAVLESASSSVCELCEPDLLSPVCNPPGAGCLVEEFLT